MSHYFRHLIGNYFSRISRVSCCQCDMLGELGIPSRSIHIYIYIYIYIYIHIYAVTSKKCRGSNLIRSKLCAFYGFFFAPETANWESHFELFGIL
jgi:hypothetical protein